MRKARALFTSILVQTRLASLTRFKLTKKGYIENRSFPFLPSTSECLCLHTLTLHVGRNVFMDFAFLRLAEGNQPSSGWS